MAVRLSVRSVVARRGHLLLTSMLVTFAQPWETSKHGNWIELSDGTIKTFRELRQKKYDDILDECIFIARASEGAISVEWVLSQPIFTRLRLVEDFKKELKRREEALNNRNQSNNR